MKRPSGIPVVAWNDVERAISALVSEHRAEMDAAQRTIEQLGKDATALATENDKYRRALAEGAEVEDQLRGALTTYEEANARGGYANERLKGELAEAKRLCACGAFDLAASPPTESTPVQCQRESCDGGIKCRCAISRRPAPPDDIRERLTPIDGVWERLNDHDTRLASLEAKGEPTMCYMTDCRYYGQRHATPHEPRDVEAGTHAFVELTAPPGPPRECRVCGNPDGPPWHTKGAEP